MGNSPKNLRSYKTNMVIFALSCAAVMIHFVFSRAFRDSLLGNGVPIQVLPKIILVGTGVALVLSFLLSWLFRHGGSSNVTRGAYLVSGSAELCLAFGHLPPHLAYKAFYVLISASTAIELSLVWLLAGNWISDDLEQRSQTVPILLVSGSVGGLLAGFGLVHLHFAESFTEANLFLAGIDILTAALLCFHCEPTAAAKPAVYVLKSYHRLGPGRVVAWGLAAATVLGVTRSTLLDLTYRISAAQRYSSRTQLLHVFGYLQAALGLITLLAQLGLSRYKARINRLSTIATCAGGEAMISVLAIIVPSFAVLTAMRTGKYALRNSFLRFGKETAYAELPNQMRQEVRPVIDVAGERIGDSIAASLMQALFWIYHGLLLRTVLISLTLISWLIWKLIDHIARITDCTENDAPEQPLKDGGGSTKRGMFTRQSLLTHSEELTYG